MTGISIEWRKRRVRNFIWLAWTPILYYSLIFMLISWVLNSEEKGIGQQFAKGFLEIFLPSNIGHEFLADPQSMMQGMWSLLFYNCFFFQSILAVILVGIVTPYTISTDQKENAFLLYFSRPLEIQSYFLGKLLISLFFVACVSLLPSLFLYTMSIIFSQDLSNFFHTIVVTGKIFLSFCIMSLVYSSIALCLSSFFDEAIYSTFAWYTVILFGFFSYLLIGEIWFSIPGHIHTLVKHVFAIKNSFPPGNAQDILKQYLFTTPPLLPSLCLSVTLVGVSLFLINHKLKRRLQQ